MKQVLAGLIALSIWAVAPHVAMAAPACPVQPIRINGHTYVRDASVVGKCVLVLVK